MNKKEQRDNALKQAREIADRAKNANRDFTSDEAKTFDKLIADADKLTEHIKAAEHDQDRLSKIATLDDEQQRLTGQKSFLKIDPAAWASNQVRKGQDRQRYTSGTPLTKALIDDGSDATGISLTPQPVTLGEPALSLFDVLPIRRSPSPQYRFLRQILRDNKAAVVAPGEVKPTSVYKLEPVEGHVRVVAHLSEPVPEFWIKDSPALQQFLASELQFGLHAAVEEMILNGDGQADNPTGIAATDGIGTQDFVESELATLRSALTKIEALNGSVSGAYILHPTDWEAVELETTSSGEFLLNTAGAGSPVESVSRRLWGQPVVTSSHAEPGTGWFVQRDAVEVVTDQLGVSLDWSNQHADLFSRNQIQARMEGRFDVSVLRPFGVIKIALSASTPPPEG